MLSMSMLCPPVNSVPSKSSQFDIAETTTTKSQEEFQVAQKYRGTAIRTQMDGNQMIVKKVIYLCFALPSQQHFEPDQKFHFKKATYYLSSSIRILSLDLLCSQRDMKAFFVMKDGDRWQINALFAPQVFKCGAHMNQPGY